MQRTYFVTYSDPEATYPSPTLETSIDADRRDIWEEALKLGFVRRIFDLETLQVVYSESLNQNFLGLSDAQVQRNFVG